MHFTEANFQYQNQITGMELEIIQNKIYQIRGLKVFTSVIFPQQGHLRFPREAKPSVSQTPLFISNEILFPVIIGFR